MLKRAFFLFTSMGFWGGCCLIRGAMLDLNNIVTPKRHNIDGLLKQTFIQVASRCRQEKYFILIRRPCLVWSCRVMVNLSAFTGAVSPLLSHRPPHPEADSVGAVLLLYIISVQYHLVLASPTQTETASGVFRTNLRISAGWSRMNSTKWLCFT
jgi:hypothetical protein